MRQPAFAASCQVREQAESQNQQHDQADNGIEPILSRKNPTMAIATRATGVSDQQQQSQLHNSLALEVRGGPHDAGKRRMAGPPATKVR